MLFKIDENLPSEVGLLLAHAGHDAVTVLNQLLGGAPDPRIMAICREEGRALVTLDLGFADIRAYPPSESPAVIVLRLATDDIETILAVAGRIPFLLEQEQLDQRLWILEEGRLRIRD